MRRSTEFGATVKHGARAVQPDIVVHVRWKGGMDGPQVGLIIGKSVGSAVERHRVARRLRHAVRTLLADMDPSEQMVIRALPSSRTAISRQLEQQLLTGLRHIHQPRRADR